MRIFTFVMVALIFIIGLTFAWLNAESVSINYYFGTTQLPLSLLLAITFVAGGFFGLLASLKTVFQVKREKFHLNQRIKLAEKEIENLRVMPLKDTR